MRTLLEERRAEFEKLTREFWDAFERRAIANDGLRICRHRLLEFMAEEKGGLSVRERQVLNLIAGGRSNKEISARLHISVRTAKFHASKVYRRLGIAGRAGFLNF